MFALLYATLAHSGDRTQEALVLLKWLGRSDPVPAMGAQWNGGNKSYGWLEQKEAGGRLPLMFGVEYYDYGPVEKRLDAREEGQALILRHFEDGGIITISDHMPNFLTGGDSWDRSANALSAILPGGGRHDEFKAYLDRMASFLQQLEVKGVPVPVLLRPFHEMNGGWFWWGDRPSGERVVQLWRFTWNYLVNVRGIRNILFVWSPNIAPGWGESDFRRYWPGRGYVDVVALDGYENTSTPDFERTGFYSSAQAVAAIARTEGLPLAFSEIGFKVAAQGQSGFWTGPFRKMVRDDLPPLSYVLIWNYEYGPRAGTLAAPSFRALVSSGDVLMLGDVSPSDLYGDGFARLRVR
ncbi:glycoside hydrolase family 26 protein [Methyloversatilis discipulorum]|uniref:glycoside hydrolase family 26 protein n=1 Tax=Methyloversatilis discipulorum TaxID=1119528 RepID=UPI003F67A81D